MPIRKETYKAVLDAALSIHTIHEGMREAIHNALSQEGDPKGELYTILTTYNIPARELALLFSEHRAQTIRWGSNNRRQQAAARKRKRGAPDTPFTKGIGIEDTTLEGLQKLHRDHPNIWHSLYGTANPTTIHQLLATNQEPESPQ